MNGKIISTALLLIFSVVAPAETEAADRTLSAVSSVEPPYKYMEKGIKTRLEDLKSAKSSGKTDGKPSTQERNGKTSSPGDYFAALKTNVAYYAGAVANISAEVQLHPHFTLDMPVSLSFWDMERAHGLRLVLFQPEARYWFNCAGSGHFLGVHAHVAGFNVQWNDWRYQSAGRPLLGGGISYGYSLRISDHWNFEFNLGAGYANMKYDRFYNIDNGAQSGSGTYQYWGITRLGLSLVHRF